MTCLQRGYQQFTCIYEIYQVKLFSVIVQYIFSKNQSYEHLAAGHVIYGLSGSPNFPIRLAHEVYNRCLSHQKQQHGVSIYDPCCGTGYLLTTIGLLNHKSIAKIWGSDINVKFTEVAQKNLGLLGTQGLDKREEDLVLLASQYQKSSHIRALESLDHIREMIADLDHPIDFQVFHRDILSPITSPGPSFTANIIITDVPYLQLVDWNGAGGINTLLNNIRVNIDTESIIAVVHDKRQRIANEFYERIERFKVGKRVIEIFRLRS